MSSHRTKSLCGGVVLIAGALTVAGCTSGTSSATAGGHSGATEPAAAPAGTPRSGGTVTIARSEGFDGWKLDSASSLVTYETDQAVMQPLLTYSASGKKIVPGLAKQWKVSPDGKSITFTLQPHAAFSNGSPVTESDVAFSVKQWKAGPNYGSVYAGIASVTAGKNGTIVFHLAKPDHFLIDALTWSIAGIVPNNFAGKSEKAFYQKPIGAGAFKIDSWNTAGNITLSRNPHYWNKGAPFVNTVKIATVTDPNQRALGFTSGKYGIVEDVEISNAANYKHGIVKSGPGTVELVIPNTKKPPFDKLSVRKAMAQAIDVHSIVAGAYKGYAVAPKGVLPLSLGDWAAPTASQTGYDPAAAKSALDAAGVGNTKKSLIYDAGSGLESLSAQVVQSDLKAAGMNVQLKGLDTNAFLAALYAGHFDLAMWINSAISPNVMDPVSFMISTHYFFSQYDTATLKHAFGAYSAASTSEARKAAVVAVQNQGARKIPLIPTADLNSLFAKQSWVHGLHPAPWGNFHYDQLWVSKR